MSSNYWNQWEKASKSKRDYILLSATFIKVIVIILTLNQMEVLFKMGLRAWW